MTSVVGGFTHPSYIVFGFILSTALCFEIVYIDIKFGEK